MSDYKQLVKLMFNSWSKTHELSSRIVDPQLRRNNIKRLQGNYRSFQSHVQDNYKPQESIEEGLIRYHHHLAELQYRSILIQNYELANKSFKLNPYPRRQENFQINRQLKQKIDFTVFAEEPSQLQ